MDSALIGVTLLSMTMAGGLSAVIWRMLRIERRRSDARVMALAAMAAEGAPAARPAQTTPPAASRPMRTSTEGATADLGLRGTAVSGSDLFSTREHPSPWGARAAVMSGLALALAAVVLFALSAQARSTMRRAAPPFKPVVAAAPPALELLSLRDSRQPGSLTITGLVQNPRGGAMLTRVTVTAFAFDETGAFLASGRALLDVTALAPGDESPFVVTVPVSENVARYRIGFRGDDGRVIAHTDRRQQGAVAAAGAHTTAGI
jgi:hypothetical protein